MRLNVSCPDYDFPDTLQLEATAYDPLDNTTRPTVRTCAKDATGSRQPC